MICQSKAAIKNQTVFDGLCVDDRAYYTELFLRDDFHLVEFEQHDRKAHVVFQIREKDFVFHLVNFTKFKTRTMTKDFMQNFVKPFCKFRGLKWIYATAERKGMARKLERMGFELIRDNIYRGEVKNVL